jgi:hypothetical protein
LQTWIWRARRRSGVRAVSASQRSRSAAAIRVLSDESTNDTARARNRSS